MMMMRMMMIIMMMMIMMMVFNGWLTYEQPAVIFSEKNINRKPHHPDITRWESIADH